jgi:hypothetical protein
MGCTPSYPVGDCASLGAAVKTDVLVNLNGDGGSHFRFWRVEGVEKAQLKWESLLVPSLLSSPGSHRSTRPLLQSLNSYSRPPGTCTASWGLQGLRLMAGEDWLIRAKRHQDYASPGLGPRFLTLIPYAHT